MGTYIKIDRKLLENEIFKNPKNAQLLRVWMYLLLNAAYERKEDRALARYGFDHLEPGQLIRSREKIARDLCLTNDQVKRLLNALQNAQMITKISSNKNTLITIVNWGVYQGSGRKQRPTKSPINAQQNIQQTSNKTSGFWPHTKKYKEQYTTCIEEIKENAPAPDGGADVQGDVPEGWDDEKEASFQESRRITPTYTRMQWWDDWHDFWERTEGDGDG